MTKHSSGRHAGKMLSILSAFAFLLVGALPACAADVASLGVEVLTPDLGDPKRPRNLKLAVRLPAALRDNAAAFGDSIFSVVVYPNDAENPEDPQYQASIPMQWVHAGTTYLDVRQPPRQSGPCECVVRVRAVSDGVTLAEGVGATRVSYTPGRADAVLVIDTSQSMIRSDPYKKRVEAAKAFIRLAKQGGGVHRIGIVAFANQAEVIAPLTALAESQKLVESLDGIQSDGMTNMDRALRAADELLQHSDSPRQAVIFLTDGKNEPRKYEDAHTRFVERGTPVYTIGLSERADHELLRRMANDTGGHAFEATSDRDLMAIYQRLAAELGRRTVMLAQTIDQPEREVMVPVDPSVRSAQFLLDAEAQVESLKLLDPAGQAIEAATKRTDEAGAGYRSRDIFTPTPGSWTVTVTGASAENPYALTVTADTDLFLDLFPVQNMGRRIILGATLASGATPLPAATLTVRDSAGQVLVSLMDDGRSGDGGAEDGVYAGSFVLSPTQETETALQLRALGQADGADFVREATTRFKPTDSAALPPEPELQDRIISYPLDLGTVIAGETKNASISFMLVSERAQAVRFGTTAPARADDVSMPDDCIFLPESLPTVTQPGRHSTRLALRVPADAEPGDYAGTIRLRAGGAESSSPVRFVVAPVRLRLSPETVDLGVVQPGRTVEAGLKVHLSAPRALPLQWTSASDDVGLALAGDLVRPGQGSPATLWLRLPADASAGAATRTLTLRCGPARSGLTVRYSVPVPVVEELPDGQFTVSLPQRPSAEPPQLPSATEPETEVTDIDSAASPLPVQDHAARRAWDGMRAELFWLMLLLTLLLVVIALIVRAAVRDRMTRFATLSLLIHAIFVLVIANTLVATDSLTSVVERPHMIAQIVNIKRDMGLALTEAEEELLRQVDRMDAAETRFRDNSTEGDVAVNRSEASAVAHSISRMERLREREEPAHTLTDLQRDRIEMQRQQAEPALASLPEMSQNTPAETGPVPQPETTPQKPLLAAAPMPETTPIRRTPEPRVRPDHDTPSPTAPSLRPDRVTPDPMRRDLAAAPVRPLSSPEVNPELVRDRAEETSPPKEDTPPTPASFTTDTRINPGEAAQPSELPADRVHPTRISDTRRAELTDSRSRRAEVHRPRESISRSEDLSRHEAPVELSAPTLSLPGETLAQAPESSDPAAAPGAIAEPMLAPTRFDSSLTSSVSNPARATPAPARPTQREEDAVLSTAGTEPRRISVRGRSHAPLSRHGAPSTRPTTASLMPRSSPTLDRPASPAPSSAPINNGPVEPIALSAPERMDSQPGDSTAAPATRRNEVKALNRAGGSTPLRREVDSMRTASTLSRTPPERSRTPLRSSGPERTLPPAPEAPRSPSLVTGDQGTAPPVADPGTSSLLPMDNSGSARFDSEFDPSRAPLARTRPGTRPHAGREALLPDEPIRLAEGRESIRRLDDLPAAPSLPTGRRDDRSEPSGPTAVSTVADREPAASSVPSDSAPHPPETRPAGRFASSEPTGVGTTPGFDRRAAPTGLSTASLDSSGEGASSLRERLRARGTPLAAPTVTTEGTSRQTTSTQPGAVSVVVGEVRFGSDWNSSPMAVANLVDAYRRRVASNIKVEKRTVPLDMKSLVDCQMLFLTGNLPFSFSDGEIDALRSYLAARGLVWINDSSSEGDETFDRSVRRELARVLPTKLAKIRTTAPLFTSAYDLSKGYLGYDVPPGDKYRVDYVEGIDWNGRLAILYTRNDYADGMALNPALNPIRPSLTDLSGEEMAEGSLRFGINVVAYAMGSDNAALLADSPQNPLSRQVALDPSALTEWQRFDGHTVESAGWQLVGGWGNPALLSLAPDGKGGQALRVDMKEGPKHKVAIKYDIPAKQGGRLDLSAASSIVVDVYNGHNGGFGMSLVVTTEGEQWQDFESKSLYLRPGWNRDLQISLKGQAFKTRQTGWKNYDSAIANPKRCGKITLLFYNRGQIRASVLIDNIRLQMTKGK